MQRSRNLMTALALSAVTLLVAAAPGSAQQSGQTAKPSAEDVKAVLVPIDQLFAGMKARDSAMIVNAFVPAGRLIDIATRNGQTTVGSLAPAQFAASLKGAPAGDLIERYWDPRIEIEDNVASVWIQYDFSIGPQFSHCGIDALQLAKTPEGWKIVQIMDTRRRTNCGKPPA